MNRVKLRSNRLHCFLLSFNPSKLILFCSLPETKLFYILWSFKAVLSCLQHFSFSCFGCFKEKEWKCTGVFHKGIFCSAYIKTFYINSDSLFRFKSRLSFLVSFTHVKLIAIFRSLNFKTSFNLWRFFLKTNTCFFLLHV
jgi:hypothetical protein